ncbi:MAG: DUF6504 family protein [Anaerolineales bacterium]
MSDFHPLHFIGEPVEAGFEQPPALEKKPGCPNYFIWRGKTYRIVEMLSEWFDYTRRGRAARNTRSGPQHAAVASQRGSWGVGRYYFRVRVEGDRIFELYYDRAPQGADKRKGKWFLVSELGMENDK